MIITLKRDIAARANVILREENAALIEENKRLKDSRFAWIVIGACVASILIWTVMSR